MNISRDQSIGAVIFFGVTFSVLLTLFVVPTVYTLIAKNTRSPEYVSRLIEGLKKNHPHAPENARGSSA